MKVTSRVRIRKANFNIICFLPLLHLLVLIKKLHTKRRADKLNAHIFKLLTEVLLNLAACIINAERLIRY